MEDGDPFDLVCDADYTVCPNPNDLTPEEDVEYIPRMGTQVWPGYMNSWGFVFCCDDGDRCADLIFNYMHG